MSVDTYLKRKNLRPYSAVDYEGVRIYIANTLQQWARQVLVDAKRGLFSKSFVIEAEHQHGATCRH